MSAQEQRSEPPSTSNSGKKVRQRKRESKRESLRQPRTFQAPGTEVKK